MSLIVLQWVHYKQNDGYVNHNLRILQWQQHQVVDFFLSQGFKLIQFLKEKVSMVINSEPAPYIKHFTKGSSL